MTDPAAEFTFGSNYGLRLRLARLVLAWERAWPALWPALGVAGCFAALALFDALPHLPGWLHLLILIAFVGAFSWALYRARGGFARPAEAAAVRRLEQASGLAHRPLVALADRLAAGGEDPQTAALWRMHLAHMAEAAQNLRVGMPAPGLPRRDPWALRAIVLLLLVVALGYGARDASERFARAFTPGLTVFAPAVAPKFEIWVTPPAYTGLAPIFPKTLAQDQSEISVPVGSQISAQVSGGRGAAELVLGAERTQFEVVDEANRKLAREVTTGGRLVLELGGRPLGAWQVTLVPDLAPSIAFANAPQTSVRNTLRVAYSAKDDYGIETVKAEMRRTYEQGAVMGKEVHELELSLPAPNAKSANETTYHDLTPHPWAGLAVVMRLHVTDAIGQAGESEEVHIVLPERAFKHPVARAIIEQRKRLTTEPEKRDAIRDALRDIAQRPAAFNHDTVVFLALSAAFSRLSHEKGAGAIPPVRELLWDTALHVEDGPLSLAERELRRAQQALMRALQEGATDAEIEQLMREVEQALNRFMQALAEQMRMSPEQFRNMPMDPRMQAIESADLRRLMEQIRELLRSGARDAARNLLAQLRNMLENMRFGMMPQDGDGETSEAMRQLQEMMQRQQNLLDQTFRQSRERGRARGQPGRPSPESQQGAQEQRGIQDMLRQLRNMLGRMGEEMRQALEGAERAMGEAADALDRDSPGEAVGPEGQALNQLQQFGRGMMQDFLDRFAREPGSPQDGRANPGQQRRDPLGRPLPNEGDVDTSDVGIPEQADVQRARQILDELRRRASQRERPRFELDYINRLLERF